MKHLIISCLPIVLLTAPFAGAQPESAAGIHAVAPEFSRLVSAGVKIEKVAGGFQFTEGPLWLAVDSCLIFSDIPANRIVKWAGGELGKGISSYREPSQNSNGLTLDRQGRLLICEHGSRRLVRLEKDGTSVTLAERFEGKRLNSPNDVIVRSDGMIYFTDPPYGVKADQRELDFQGVYRVSPDGQLTLLAKDFDKPNGLAFSPDEKTLYIDDTARHQLRAFDVAPDGSISHGRLFADMKGPGDGAPDGMKVDQEGNIYCTGAGGVWVFDKNGKLLGKIALPEVPANVGWGDADFKTLYMTARKSLYRIRVNIAGIKP